MNLRKTKRYRQEFTGKTTDLERTLVAHISNTGKEQIKRRKKAGLSVYYLRNGRIVEVKPDKTETLGTQIKSRWVTLDQDKRTLILK